MHMAGQSGQVVTLQLGQYANYVGSHWWNLQKAEFSQSQDCEVCSDILFRRGVTLRGAVTYTPRLIALDLKEHASSVREGDALYEDGNASQSVPAWRGNVSVHREDGSAQQGEAGAPAAVHDGGLPCTAPPADHTEKTSWAWSDVLQTQLHPKSLCIVNGHHRVGDVDGLESFSQGEAMFRSQLEEIEDRLHFFTEECDYLQGFQLLCDVHNGFSGVGVRMVEHLHDEYPGRGILSFGTCPVPSDKRDPCKAVYQLMNCVRAVGPLSSCSSLFCPLSVASSLGRRPGPSAVFPQLLYDASLQYHSSAVLAVALNTLTLPYRMSSSGLSMSHYVEALTFGGRKVLAAACALPFPLSSAMSLPDALLPHQSAAPWCSVSACRGADAIFSQSVVLRGIPEPRPHSNPPGRWPPSSLHVCESGEQALQQYLRTLYPRTLSMIHLLGTPCKLGPTFPQFFSPSVSKDGFTEEEPQSVASVVGQIPVLCALQTSSALEVMLRSLCDEVSMAVVRRWMNSSTAAVEQEDFREAVHDVRTLALHYRAREGSETDDSD